MRKTIIYDRIFIYKVEETLEFLKWLVIQNLATRKGVEARIARIKLAGHFGDAKKIDSEIAELRWRNGLRIYFSYYIESNGKTVILILGGNKNTQKFDIEKARRILKKIRED